MPPYYSSSNWTIDFLYTLSILAIGFLILWVFCKILRIKRLGIPEFGAIILAFGMSPLDLMAILWAVLPSILGFISGRSTKVLLDPTDITSPRVKLSDEEYAYRAEQYQMIMKSSEAQRFFLSPYHDVIEKQTMLFEGQRFGLYRHARSLALLTSLFYFSIWSAANQSYGTELYLLLCILSLPFGHVMGLLWKYIKGHPGPPKIEIGGKMCKPTIRSFIYSFLYSLSPAIGAGIMTYILYEQSKTLVIFLDAIAGLFCIYLLVQTIFVHLKKISLLEDGIIITGIVRPYGLRWTDIEKATIRERHNLLSGTDKLLVLYTKQGNKMYYPISILSKRDENEISREVRKRVPTSSTFDKSSL